MPQEIPTLEFMHHTPFSKILITSANWRQSIICILSFDRFGICFNNSLWEQLDKYMCILYLLELEMFQVLFNLLSTSKDYYTLWHLVRTVKVIEIDILMGCHCTAYTSYHTIISCVSHALKSPYKSYYILDICFVLILLKCIPWMVSTKNQKILY